MATRPSCRSLISSSISWDRRSAALLPSSAASRRSSGIVRRSANSLPGISASTSPSGRFSSSAMRLARSYASTAAAAAASPSMPASLLTTTPPRWPRLPRKLWKAWEIPAQTPDTARAGVPSTESTVRTLESSESAASTALSVMCPTFSSSSLTWSIVVDALPSIGTTSPIVCLRLVSAVLIRPPRRTSAYVSPTPVRIRKIASAMRQASEASIAAHLTRLSLRRHYYVSVVQDGGLTGRDAVRRLVQLELQTALHLTHRGRQRR